jgi:hypothetical protein
VVPIFTGGQFVSGATFGFVYSPGSVTCSGSSVSSCSVGPHAFLLLAMIIFAFLGLQIASDVSTSNVAVSVKPIAPSGYAVLKL